MRSNNYYVIQGWMLNQLGLSSMNEIGIYAVIYGFSQDGRSKYTGTIKYLQECTLIKSDKTVREILKSLVTKELIYKHELEINGVVFNHYSVNAVKITEEYENLLQGAVKITDTPSKNYRGGAVKITDNNKRDKNIDKDSNINILTDIVEYFNEKANRNKYQRGSERATLDKYLKSMVKNGDTVEDIKTLIDYKLLNPNTQKIDLLAWLNTEYVGQNMALAKEWNERGRGAITRFNHDKPAKSAHDLSTQPKTKAEIEKSLGIEINLKDLPF